MAKNVSDNEWQVDSDLRTLMEASKIRSDPKRLKAAQDLARERCDTMTKIRLGASDADGDE